MLRRKIVTAKYRGLEDDRRYEGKQVDITYNVKRCIHAEECVHRAAAVFNLEQRPWIQPDKDAPDNIIPVIVDCPSGALHFVPKDGAAAEVAPDTNTIVVHDGSYYQFHGNLQLQGGNIDIKDETRVTLCRCGGSENKPFCDNSHRELDFETPLKMSDKETSQMGSGPLRIEVFSNGPIEIEGSFTIQDASGGLIFQGENKKTWLCRCGGSQSKPFCDQTHRTNGFQAP
jgi:CDGSH-type Zn-finger protein/uncharacterized Fe-S cluster protein YjdI